LITHSYGPIKSRRQGRQVGEHSSVVPDGMLALQTGTFLATHQCMTFDAASEQTGDNLKRLKDHYLKENNLSLTVLPFAIFARRKHDWRSRW